MGFHGFRRVLHVTRHLKLDVSCSPHPLLLFSVSRPGLSLPAQMEPNLSPLDRAF